MKNDSKITRAERTLEKTVQQAEFIAGQIAKNAADGCFVACPECGQLIPTPYSGFISREAADRYALDHCDCQQVKTRITAACSDEIMPADQMTYIMLQRAPQDRWEPPQKLQAPHFGACRYCGQVQSVYGCADDAAAEEYATLRCKCSGAVAYQDKIKAENRREIALAEARENIDDLFGAGAEERGDEAICEDVIQILNDAAGMVYDGKIRAHQMALTHRIKSKITRNSKGNLEIERKDAKSSKMEVKQ